MFKFTGMLTVVIAFCGLFTGTAQAQCSSRTIYGSSIPSVTYSSPTVVYQTPTIIKEIITPVVEPVIVPVIVPAYSFQYSPAPSFPIQAAPQAPCAQYPGVGLPTTGPYASPYTAGYGQQAYGQPQGPPQGYGQQNTGYGQAAPGQITDEQIRLIAQAVIAEMQKGPSDSGPPPIPGFAPPSSPGGPPTPPNSGPGPGPGPGPGGYPTVAPSATPPPAQPIAPGNYPATSAGPQSGKPLANSVHAVNAIAALSRNCAYCHTGGGSRGDTILFVQPGILNPDAPFRSVERELGAGRMPPRNSQFRPAPEEYATIMAWLSGQ